MYTLAPYDMARLQQLYSGGRDSGAEICDDLFERALFFFSVGTRSCTKLTRDVNPHVIIGDRIGGRICGDWRLGMKWCMHACMASWHDLCETSRSHIAVKTSSPTVVVNDFIRGA